MVTEIVPGLFRLSIPMTAGGLGWTTPYVFRGNDGLTLFDCGYGTRGAIEALTEQIGELDGKITDIKRLFVSHAHPDHLGMAKWIKDQAPGCELVMMGQERFTYGQIHHRDPEQAERDSNAWALKHGLDMTVDLKIEDDGPRRWINEERELDKEIEARRRERTTDTATTVEMATRTLGRIEPDVRLRDGDEYSFDGWSLKAVWTPGHTPGHLCIYDPERKFTFTGDHVLSRITPNVSLSSEDEEIGRSPLREFRASLQKVADLDSELGLPAHQDTISDLPKRCLEILEHHDERLDEVYNALGGRISAAEVAENVEWSKPYETFSIFKRRAALGETLSHLQVLVEDGRVRRVELADNRVVSEHV